MASVPELIQYHNEQISKNSDTEPIHNESSKNDNSVVSEEVLVSKNVKRQRKEYEEMKKNTILYMPQKGYKVAKMEDYDMYVSVLEGLYPDVFYENEKKLSSMTKAHIFANKRPHNEYLIGKKEAFNLLNHETKAGYDIHTTGNKIKAIREMKRIKRVYGDASDKAYKIQNENKEEKPKKKINIFMTYMIGKKKEEKESTKEYRDRIKNGYAQSLGYDNYEMFKNHKRYEEEKMQKNDKKKKDDALKLRELKNRRSNCENELNMLKMSPNVDNDKTHKLKAKIYRLERRILKMEKRY